MASVPILIFSALLAGCGRMWGGVSLLTGNPVQNYNYFLYVSDNTNAKVASFLIDKTTGNLTYANSVSAASGMHYMSFDPVNDRLFIGPAPGPDIYVYTADTSTGALTLLKQNPIAFAPNGSVPSLDGNYLFVSSLGGPLNSYAVDSTGTFTANVTSGPNSFGRPIIDSTGKYVYNPYIANSQIIAYKNTGGALSAIGTYTTGINNDQSLAIDATDTYLYSGNHGSADIAAYKINAATGALSYLANYGPTQASPTETRIDSSNSHLFTYDAGGLDVSTFAINSSDGSLTQLGFTAVTGNANSDFVVHPTGSFIYVSDGGVAGNINVYAVSGSGAVAAAPIMTISSHLVDPQVMMIAKVPAP